MTEHLGAGWGWFVALITIASLVALFALNIWMSRGRPPDGTEVGDTGHVWDEDLRELNNPLPRWWLNLFYITLVFAVAYLVLYPGLGSFAGVLGWTQTSQYRQEMNVADARFGPIFDKYAKESLKALGNDPDAMKIGARLFLNYCATCHGADAKGGAGFPNLTDHDWLWGGTPEAIRTTILDGRSGMMPPWKDAVGGDKGVYEVAQYVLSLSDRKVDASAAGEGKAKYMVFCVACHGPEGKGSQALGAPNLTDNIWLHGGSQAAVETSIGHGRQGRMPAHKDFLGEAKVHLLAAYIYHISR
jgi:cytochrome c oxidase cbb3-type subunit III